MKKTFPIDLLKPKLGRIGGDSESCLIEIPLAPFSIDGKNNDACITLEGIELPSMRLEELAYSQHEFPFNPVDGYIDGSVFIVHAHHPIDVSRIEFGSLKGGGIEATIQMVIRFEYEGLQADSGNTEFVDTETTIRAILRT